MKFSFVGAGAALALASVLAGCGGKAQFTVQGTIDGLNNSGLVLSNGSDTVNVPAGATSFALPRQIDYGTDFDVEVKTQPAHMTCGFPNGNNIGSAGHNIAIQMQLQCVQNSYTLGGQFTGLTVAADGTTARTVTLLNGSTSSPVTISSATATAGAGDFTFSTPVADGQTYGVTVVDPNNGLSCTIANGTGVMHDANVSNLIVTCVPK